MHAKFEVGIVLTFNRLVATGKHLITQKFMRHITLATFFLEKIKGSRADSPREHMHVKLELRSLADIIVTKKAC